MPEVRGQVFADVALEQVVPPLQLGERQAGPEWAGVNVPLLVGSVLLTLGILFLVVLAVTVLSGCAAREPRLPGLY